MKHFPPLHFEWSGAVMVPLQSHLAQKFYLTGQRYTLAPFEDRSSASHKHEFAWLRAAWETLPDRLAERFPTEEHLRKWALIRAGYYHSSTLLCHSHAEAMRTAAFLRPIDDFALVLVDGRLVTRYVALSQKRKRTNAETGEDNGGMDNAEFQKSKDAIIEVIARLLGVDPEDLRLAHSA